MYFHSLLLLFIQNMDDMDADLFSLRKPSSAPVQSKEEPNGESSKLPHKSNTSGK